MEMFGGLTRTSSRIAIAAAFGLGLGVYALSASPASAQGYGGNCCADLEERVAELEASTVQKGNKKVSVTISGWVIESMNWWDDGDLQDSWVGTKDVDLGSRFAITGSASIAPGWSGGYNLTVTTPGQMFGGFNGGNNFGVFSNQFAQDSISLSSINTLYSYMYIKSDDYGTINLGYLSPASDNAAVLADISGTVIESNVVFFEGGSFIMRPKGAASGFNGISPVGLTWNAFTNCSLVGGVGGDCYGAPQNGIRYDSPTWGGFRFEASYTDVYQNNRFGSGLLEAPEVWDLAVFYNGDLGDFKLSAAYSYTNSNGNLFSADPTASSQVHQFGGTVMHAPSGVGIYGYYNYEEIDGNYVNFAGTQQGIPSWDSWYLKPFIKRTWNPLGSTVLYGEYGQYNDGFNGIAGASQCASFGAGTVAGNYCAAGGVDVNGNLVNGVFVTGSEVERWGLGVVQEIDAAAMHVFARWQHQDADIDFVGYNSSTGVSRSVSQGFDDYDLFQVGGIIFF
ncbi:MAG: porin [Hyphomicrobiaceae bacterium]|nr:porin [Hyphomicrobiaceae bacterium]